MARLLVNQQSIEALESLKQAVDASASCDSVEKTTWERLQEGACQSSVSGALDVFQGTLPVSAPKGYNRFMNNPARRFGELETYFGKDLSQMGNVPVETTKPPATTFAVQSGQASYYGVGEKSAGKHTAFGARLDPNVLAIAHLTLPFGTLVEIRAKGKDGTERSIQAVVADRGPYVKGRIADLSPRCYAALTGQAWTSAAALKDRGLLDVTIHPVTGSSDTAGTKSTSDIM